MKIKDIICKRRGARASGLVFSGIIMALALVFPRIGFLSWIAMVPAAVILITMARDGDVSLRRMYGYGFLYFFSFYATGFHWFIALYPLSFIEGMGKLEALFVVFLATFGLGALQASFSALFGVLLAFVARRGIVSRHRCLLPVAAALMYGLFEWAQTFTWAGVPWSRLAIGQVESAVVLKSVSLFGPYFLGALIVCVNFFIAEFLLADEKKQKSVSLITATLIVAVNASIGAILVSVDRDSGRAVTVAAVQPNVSSRDPWGFNTTTETMQTLERLSLEASERGATLIVWPETVFPMDFDEGSPVYDFTVEIARRCGATIVVGAFSEGEELERNSLFFVSPDGEVSETVYSKRHLVPFGEFVPMRGFFEAVFPSLVALLMLDDDLEESKNSDIADTDAGKLGAIICFDSIYETLTVDSVRDGAELLVLATNDSWFLESAAVTMHSYQARLRAAETGRYMVRSATTGISMVISPDGKVLDDVPELSSGYALATVDLRSGRTLYTVIGNTFSYISLAAVLAATVSAVIEWWREIQKNKNKI